jgi:hypothetical protein
MLLTWGTGPPQAVTALANRVAQTALQKTATQTKEIGAKVKCDRGHVPSMPPVTQGLGGGRTRRGPPFAYSAPTCGSVTPITRLRISATKKAPRPGAGPVAIETLCAAGPSLSQHKAPLS